MKKNPGQALAQGHEHRQHAARHCLDLISTGTATELFGLLPQIAVLHDHSFLEPLVEMLEDRSIRKREFAVLGLGALRDARALGPLFNCFHAADPEKVRSHHTLRLAIFHAIGEIGSDQATSQLRRLLPGGPEGVIDAAEKNLLVEALGHIAQHGGPAAMMTLVELASGKDTAMCVHAIQNIAVAFWHRPSALPENILLLLLDRLEDEVGRVRAAALGALENLAHLGCIAAERALDSRF